MITDEDKIKVIIPVSCAIITKIDEDGLEKILLIQRDKKDHFPLMWEVPRGKCDKQNESLIQCLKRETKEEIGIDVEPIKYIGKFSYIADNGTRKSIQYNFLCKIKNPSQKIKLSFEHQDYKWVNTMGEVSLHVMPELIKLISSVFDQEHKIFDTPDINKKFEEKILEYHQLFIGSNNV